MKNRHSSSYRLIMGRNALKELVKASPERIVEVKTSLKESDLHNLLKEHKVPITQVSKEHLNKLVQSESHQSFVAAVKERHSITIKDFLNEAFEKELCFVLMLDSIYDPQNLGAILRAAECFGVDLVVFSKNRGTDITAVVSKTSVGATELVPITKVSNLAETAKLFQKEGFEIVTAEAADNSVSLRDFKYPKKTVLILGSEGEGVQSLLSRRADHKVKIDMKGQIDSLNVSQAAAVFLSNWN